MVAGVIDGLIWPGFDESVGSGRPGLRGCTDGDGRMLLVCQEGR